MGEISQPLRFGQTTKCPFRVVAPRFLLSAPSLQFHTPRLAESLVATNHRLSALPNDRAPSITSLRSPYLLAVLFQTDLLVRLLPHAEVLSLFMSSLGIG